MPSPIFPVLHSSTSESALSSPSDDSIASRQTGNATPFVQVNESYDVNSLSIENAQNTGNSLADIISKLITQSAARDTAFDALHELLSEMQMELSGRRWNGDGFDRCERASALRGAIWDAICTYRDAWMERV